ncbi:hypothetical protein CDAR_244731 [Caerostris darwini]|uniref:Uncharacterized protein n=1 Tax=Caerostris darwini TaxID=1538125 RepID=A0AAV4ML90_9ARAC|nr:hypothetical protein CDAR_244731 [Caerostris darwini]
MIHQNMQRNVSNETDRAICILRGARSHLDLSLIAAAAAVHGSFYRRQIDRAHIAIPQPGERKNSARTTNKRGRGKRHQIKPPEPRRNSGALKL